MFLRSLIAKNRHGSQLLARVNLYIFDQNNCFQISSFRLISGKTVATEMTVEQAKPTVEAIKTKKLSKAMKAYLERSQAYNEFIQREEQDFSIGKRHLANMMGQNPETFTQKDIDESIEYLFPSGLFDKRARPMMKPPKEVFPPRKDAEFDESGRPFHYLFYTGKPNFYNLLHQIVDNLNRLERFEKDVSMGKQLPPVNNFDPSGSEWLKKETLELITVEKLTDVEYFNFTSAMDRLIEYKYCSLVGDFIMKQRKPLMETSMSFDPEEPSIDTDGRKFITTRNCPRKNARADVTVRSPGTGKISINGEGIQYFPNIQSRNQILFPLELTGLKDSVDIEATVSGGGTTGQAGAIRWGISWGLRNFVTSEMRETMRLAGLLTRDFRRRERKKPGQAKARKKFTWKKR